MFSFTPCGHTSLRGTADLTDHTYANIAFLDQTQEQILLHISLRPEEGIVSWNNWSPEAEWGPEGRHEVTLLRGENTVQVDCNAIFVQLLVNGEKVFSSYRRFRKLNQARFASCIGGISADRVTVRSLCPWSGKPTRGLQLLPGFQVEATVPAGTNPENAVLTLDGIEAPPETYLPEMPDYQTWQGRALRRSMVRMELPGRVWMGGQQDLTLFLRDRDSGAVLAGPLQIDRNAVQSQIEDLAQRGRASHHIQDTTRAIEHCHFTGLFDALSADAQEFISASARLLQAGEFSPPSAALSEDTADRVGLARMLRRFRSATKTAPESDWITAFEAHLTEANLKPDVQIAAFLAVADDFLARGVFGDLFHTFSRMGLDLRKFNRRGVQERIAALPFFYRLRAYGQVLRTLHRVADVTPPLQRAVIKVARQYLEDSEDHSGSDDHEHLPWALAHKIRTMVTHGGAVDSALIAVAARLLLEGERIAEGEQPGVCREITACFALHPGFHQALERICKRAGKSIPPAVRPVLAAARRVLEGPEALGQDTWRSEMAVLEHYGVDGVLPLRRAYGCDGPEMNVGPEAVEWTLRQAAKPGADPVRGEDQKDIRALIAAKQPGTPAAPHHFLQIETSRQVMEMLRSARAGEALSRQDMFRVLRRLEILSGAGSYWIGLALALDLARGLAGTHPEEAEEIADFARGKATRKNTMRSAGGPAGVGQTRDTSPALSAVMGRIHRDHAEQANPLLAGLIEAFSGVEPLPAGQAEPEGLLAGLFDTMVVVVSCQPNLNTRIARIRKSWLAQLKDYDIPHIVVVGGGTDTQEGDVVYLDAPDDYEGLPFKTLKAVEWVATQTRYGHMLKIDDDCFLGVESFFLSQSHRKFDYYGRRLDRDVGGIDRAWHHSKSKSERGRYELDRSPEPSVYAEGGSGYTLSRRAMWAILNNRETPQGRGLIRRSFMEDKMIGDLLAQSAIRLSSEDYFVSTLRRVAPGVRPVSLWQNGVFPSQVSPVKVVHLDSIEGFDKTDAVVSAPRILPPKLWPAARPLSFGFGTNMLEYLGSPEQIDRFASAPVAVAAVMHNEGDMAAQFLAHYRELGVTAFAIIDNLSDDGTLDYLAEQDDVALFSVDTPPELGGQGSVWLQTLLGEYRVDQWTLLADAGEHLLLDGTGAEDLSSLLALPEIGAAQAVRGVQLDLYPGAEMGAVDISGGELMAQTGYADREPITAEGQSALRQRLPGKAWQDERAEKIALVKYQPWMRLVAGMHELPGARLSDQGLILAHYGTLTGFDPELSVPWGESTIRQHIRPQG